MDDNRIIELFWERDEEAIEAAAEKYGSYCMSVAFNILSGKEDAEECVSDAYNRAWNSIPPKKPESLRAFLGCLTRNAALDRRDYLYAARRDQRLNSIFEELSQCLPAHTDVEQIAEDEQVVEVINSFLSSIELKKRQVFVRRYWYSDSVEDISVMFGMTQSAVKSMLFRLRTKLREHLAREEIYYE